MAYTKVYSFRGTNSNNDNVNSNAVGWKYFFETFLPTVGWTVTLCDDNSANPPTGTNVNHFYFLKKTLEFTDGTTDVISFCYLLQPNIQDLRVYSWDGVLATNDSSDPQFGRGSDSLLYDNHNYVLALHGDNNNNYEIWKDSDSDSWFWLKNGIFVGVWFPNGNWVRQDFAYSSGTEYMTRHVVPHLCFDSDNNMARHYDGNNQLKGHLPIDLPNKRKGTNYINLSCNNYAMWRGTSNNIIVRASRVSLTTGSGIYTKTIKSGNDYYFGMTDTSADIGILFNVGTTDPGI